MVVLSNNEYRNHSAKEVPTTSKNAVYTFAWMTTQRPAQTVSCAFVFRPNLVDRDRKEHRSFLIT